MKNLTIGKMIPALTVTLIASIFLAIAAGVAGFLFSFLLFGDGSELYFGLQKIIPIEPYVFMALALSILAFLFTWVVAFVLFRNYRETVSNVSH